MSLARSCALLLVASGALACSSSSTASDGGPDGTSPTDGGSKDASDSATPKDASKDRSSPGDAEMPSLVELNVTSKASPPLTLIPAFSPTVYDYYVRCAAGSNELTVSMTASLGAESKLTSPITSPALPKQTLPVKVNEGAAIVAVASEGTAATPYWVRCLPSDFPVLQWSPHTEAGTPTAGYYLVGSFKPPTGESGYAMVLDSRGVPVWYYLQTGGIGVVNVDTVVDGAVSFIPSPSPKPYEILQLSPWGVTKVGNPGQDDEHELRPLSGGSFMIIASPLEAGIDLTGLTLPLPDGGAAALGPNSDIHTCNILELDSTGTVTWSWLGLDHLDPVKDCTYPQSSGTGDAGLIIDPFHCNAIDVDPDNGNLLLSARHMDSVVYIEKATGKILWKLGGAEYTKDNATYVTVSDPFYRQHDARLQPGWSASCSGGSGQISMFDDETAAPGPARAVVYDVSVGAGDGGSAGDCGVAVDAGAAARVWQYQGTVSSIVLGSFRIGADGSRVIGWGLRAPAKSVTFTEVDIHGNDEIDFTIDPGSGNTSYRAIKVPLTAFDLSTLRSTSGHP
jgi:hypothetical protein